MFAAPRLALSAVAAAPRPSLARSIGSLPAFQRAEGVRQARLRYWSRMGYVAGIATGALAVGSYFAYRAFDPPLYLEQPAYIPKEKPAPAKTESAPVEPHAVQGDASTEESAGGDQSQAAAYNEETGEINWDCPCLGGMAHGPCGPQFREAFSCFVHSEEEPKGVDCVEKFKNMQDCFRQHPELYGETDIEDDEPEQALTGLEEQALKEGAFDGDDELLKAVYAALEDKKEESQ